MKLAYSNHGSSEGSLTNFMENSRGILWKSKVYLNFCEMPQVYKVRHIYIIHIYWGLHKKDFFSPLRFPCFSCPYITSFSHPSLLLLSLLLHYTHFRGSKSPVTINLDIFMIFLLLYRQPCTYCTTALRIVNL